MFTKIDKKILIISIIVLVLIITGIFTVYKYLMNNSSQIKITEEQKMDADTAKNSEQTPGVKLQDPNIEIQGTGTGALTVCLDKCGDGICQKTDPACKNGNLNCICPETTNECPQDCYGN